MDNSATTIVQNILLPGKPKVSIIVATFRRDSSLRESLKSLTNQTYSNFEIIVVDDNANSFWNNKTRCIISEFIGKSTIEIKYIVTKKNEGSAKTRNLGIKNATGEYITFLDDDDIYLPNKVENQVNHMIDCQSDYSLTDLWLYNDKGILIEKRIRDYLQDNSYKSLLKYHIMYHMTGTDVMMFKTDYLKEIGGFPHIDVGDEFYLMQKAIEGMGKFSYLEGCDVKAIVHNEISGLSSGEGKIKGENELYNYKKGFFHILDTKAIRYIRMRHFAVLAFAELRRSHRINFLKYAIMSFFNSPIQSAVLLMKRRKK